MVPELVRLAFPPGVVAEGADVLVGDLRLVDDVVARAVLPAQAHLTLGAARRGVTR